MPAAVYDIPYPESTTDPSAGPSTLRFPADWFFGGFRMPAYPLVVKTKQMVP